MTATTFCDSAGITALVRASRRAEATGATMRVAAIGPSVLRVFSLVGIDRLIDIHPAVDDARASLPDQEPDQEGGWSGDSRLTRARAWSGDRHQVPGRSSADCE